MKKISPLIIFIFIFGLRPGTSSAGQDDPKVVIQILLGDFSVDISLELYPEQAPNTVSNFLQYVNSDYYDGLIFHRAIDDFMIQGGGYEPWVIRRTEGLQDPIENESDNGLRNLRGTIAMALAPGEPNSATSEFFINQVHNDHLDGVHCVFGKVLSGMNVVDFIAQLPELDPNLVGMREDVPVYIDPNGESYWVYVYQTFVAPNGYWPKGDLTYNGIVNFRDFAIFALNWQKYGTDLHEDLDGNNKVDSDDLEIFANHWLRTAVWYRAFAGDFNNSNTVNFRDFAILASEWQQTKPEPLADTDLSGTVDMIDLMYFAEDWLKTTN